MNRTTLVATLWGVLLASSSATQTAQSLKLEDYYRIETATDPVVSANGRFVAFTRTYTDEETNKRRDEVWLAETDGGEPPRRISNPTFDSDSPRFSPDGNLLVMRSARDNGSIWFIDLERGGEAFTIEGVDSMPKFSPDGKWLAFNKATPPVEERAEKSELEQELEKRFTGKMYDWMQFRFDRRGYLPDPTDPYASPSKELYVVPAASGEPRQLTKLGVDVTDFAWSPDGSRLVATADLHQRDEYVYPRADVWLVSLDGGMTRLTDDGFNHSTPVFSPDGGRIAFRRVKGLTMVIEAQQHRGAPTDIYTMTLSSKKMTNVTESWELRPGSPTFSADGERLYFQAGVSGNSHLFRAPASGGEVERVTTGDRRLSSFSFSKDFTSVAYVGRAPSHPDEVFVSQLDGSNERNLSQLNDSWLGQVTLAKPERILYPSQDGTEIEGWYLRPVAGTPEPYPLILAIHGGPHGAYGHQFMFEFQLWAAAGYGVVYTNPRGSAGYGEDFLYATWGGWGLKDSEDVLAGADHVIDRYPIDPSRTGVTGYSYGGFLTNWILGQTTRFTAAISGAGISNWVSDYATADIPRTKESEFYGQPWQEESGALLRRLSPITYAGKMRTPTLFIHGESDFRVPIEQAEQMYVAFKKQKVPAKMIRYPDSYHGGWAPWDMVHRYYHGLKWWEQYLDESASTSQ